MSSPTRVDRELLHQYLWKYSDRSNFIPWKPGELAHKLGLTIYTMSRLLTELVKAGRLTKVGSKYLVIDPNLAMWGSHKSPGEQTSMF